MARELLTSWGEFQAAIDRLLAIAEREIQIHDGDLSRLKLDTSQRLEHLKRLLHPQRQDRIRIALQETALVQCSNPRMMRLLTDYSSGMTIQETPEHLHQLRDTLMLVDGRHGLVLFERSQPRSKLLIDEPEEIEPYRRRFSEIWQEGGTPLTATSLGL